MAIIRSTNYPKEPINEQTMIEACAGRWDGTYYKFRNFFYRWDNEADLFVISKARYATEVEVKVSLADWKADLKKGKHQTHKNVKYFYYAVPQELVDKAPDGIDERYGLIVCRQDDNQDRLHAYILKEAKPLPCEKVGKGVICRAFISVYFKQFDLRHEIRSLRLQVAELTKAADKAVQPDTVEAVS